MQAHVCIPLQNPCIKWIKNYCTNRIEAPVANNDCYIFQIFGQLCITLINIFITFLAQTADI